MAGAIYLKETYGYPEELLTAVRYHTTGRENMTLSEKILFIAVLIVFVSASITISLLSVSRPPYKYEEKTAVGGEEGVDGSNPKTGIDERCSAHQQQDQRQAPGQVVNQVGYDRCGQHKQPHRSQ